MTNDRKNDHGIALVLTLFLMSAVSVLAASLMFLSQSETYASMNYRTMSQARYAAESGVEKASNFLLDSVQYTVPGSITDPVANYDVHKSPVQCLAGCPHIGSPVTLSWDTTQSNYPSTAVTPSSVAVTTAFAAAATGNLTTGNGAVSYKATATLMAMEVFDSYGGGTAVVQTWQIVAAGTVSGPRNATVEVIATVDRPKAPAYPMAAFATSNLCDALVFHGNVQTDSYDSTTLASGASPSLDHQDGDIGTFGNVDLQGTAADIYGHMYTTFDPTENSSSCSNTGPNGTANTGLSTSGHPNLAEGQLSLPATAAFPTPGFTYSPWTLTAQTINSSLLNSTGIPLTDGTAACAALNLTYGDNTGIVGHPVGVCDLKNAAGGSALAGAVGPYTTVVVHSYGGTVAMPSVSVSSGYTLEFDGSAPAPNMVEINSITGSGSVKTVANTGATDTGQSVVLKVAGKNSDGTEMSSMPFSLDQLATSTSCAGCTNFKYDASTIQIVYPGTQTFSLAGNTQYYATLYAPNAIFDIAGTVDWYGSAVAKKMDIGGNASIHYDRKLQSDYWVPGIPLLSTFSWKKY